MQLLSAVAGRQGGCSSPGLAWLTVFCNGHKHGQDIEYSWQQDKKLDFINVFICALN